MYARVLVKAQEVQFYGMKWHTPNNYYHFAKVMFSWYDRAYSNDYNNDTKLVSI